MLKRLFDISLSAVGLLLTFPILSIAAFFVWFQDRYSPFYVSCRVGQFGQSFRMIKLRSMVVNADKSGVDSTAVDDQRITAVGQFIRRYKLDELVQLWNVLKGDMSLVGPRPNVKRETDLYTPVERRLLSVKPGITDFASIVFADEGDILRSHSDPDIAYNQLIRPGKSLLGLIYIDNQSLMLDAKLCILTLISLLSREKALSSVHTILQKLNAPEYALTVTQRKGRLVPRPPPGADQVVTSRSDSTLS